MCRSIIIRIRRIAICSFSNQVLILTEGRNNLPHFIFKLSGDLLFNSWRKLGHVFVFLTKETHIPEQWDIIKVVLLKDREFTECCLRF